MAARENPLVPYAVLRAIFTRMVEARRLEQHLLGSSKSTSADSIRGEEACRASSIVCVEAGDLLSDPSSSAAADLLRGVPLRSVLKGAPHTNLPLPHRLPRDADTRARLHTALGAAHALQLAGAKRCLLVYTRAAAAPLPFWQSALAQAATRSLPVIFLLLPANSSDQAGGLSDRAMRCGVPGIAVDSADAIALYRVMSESVARVRAGDGPVLIECMQWPAGGRVNAAPPDPVTVLAQALEARGAAGAVWQRRVGDRFARRLAQLTS